MPASMPPPTGSRRFSAPLPSASSMNGRISLLADGTTKEDSISFASVRLGTEAGPSRVRSPSPAPPRPKDRLVSRRHTVLPGPPPHLPPPYRPYSQPGPADPQTSYEDRFHPMSPPTLPMYPPTPTWHSSPIDFAIPAWVLDASKSNYVWPVEDMSEKSISQHRVSRSSTAKPPPHSLHHHAHPYLVEDHSPRQVKIHPPPFHFSPSLPPMHLPPTHRHSRQPLSPPLPASDDPVWDDLSDELLPVPGKRSYPQRRDMSRRRQQNADAQKRFRSKKKRIQEQIARELEEAKAQIRARDEIIDRLRSENLELRKINELVSGWSVAASSDA